jgi:hypothetical protein
LLAANTKQLLLIVGQDKTQGIKSQKRYFRSDSKLKATLALKCPHSVHFIFKGNVTPAAKLNPAVNSRM